MGKLGFGQSIGGEIRIMTEGIGGEIGILTVVYVEKLGF